MAPNGRDRVLIYYCVSGAHLFGDLPPIEMCSELIVSQKTGKRYRGLIPRRTIPPGAQISKVASCGECRTDKIGDSFLTRQSGDLGPQNRKPKKEKIMTCECGCLEFDRKQKGLHLGVYCKQCGKWQKWEAKPVTLESSQAFVIPFGKHKGQALRDLPRDYLGWLAENCSDEKIANRARVVLDSSRP